MCKGGGGENTSGKPRNPLDGNEVGGLARARTGSRTPVAGGRRTRGRRHLRMTSFLVVSSLPALIRMK